MGNVRVLGVRTTGTKEKGFWKSLFPFQRNQRRIRVDLHGVPYWMEQGWTRNGNLYRGKYMTRYKRCQGEIVDRAGAFDVFIFRPPRELRKHPSWHCFNKAG